MKKLLTTGFYLLFGLSLIAGCGGGGGSAIQPPPPSATPSSCPSGQSCLSLVVTPPPQTGNVGQWLQLDPRNWLTGGVLPYTVSIKSGTLPAGLALVSQQFIGGIPTATAVGTAIIFTVTDSETPAVSVDVPISLTINPMLPLAFSQGSGGALPAGTVGARYNPVCGGRGGCSYGVNVSVTGGVMPYLPLRWSPVPGSSLPPGLSLTGDGCVIQCSGGRISGTPTSAGTFNFLVTATDSELPPKQVSANYTITVAPAPSPSPSSSP